MNIIEIIAQDIFDKVRGRFSNLEMGDESGAVTSVPKDARFFDFDFATEGNDLGRVSISLNEVGTLKIFYGHDIVEDSDQVSIGIWYDFLKEMRFFAKRRMLRFDTRDIAKGNLNKNDFQYLSQNGTKENNMNESAMYGSSKTSYRKLENTLLRVRHSKTVDENQRGSRSRNINALFIENEAGERFKYPFIHLAGAKAMQRHVANGGRPYDGVGNAIIGMSEQIAQLTAFKRHLGNHDGMNEEVNEILERSQAKLDNLRKSVDGLSKQGYYEQFVNSFEEPTGEEFVMDQATMEDYKSKFTVKNFKEDLAQYFPLIHKIMQETSEVDLDAYVAPAEEPVQESDESEIRQSDDFVQFEGWADEVTTPVEEGMRTADLVADALNKKGVKYSPDKEKEIIKMIGDEMAEMGMSEKQIRYYLSYDEDFIGDTLGGLEREAEDAEGMENQEPQREQASMREVAEVVKSFYDATTGKFPKGETGVITHIKKQFGDQAAQVAERFVEQLAQKGQAIEQQQMVAQQFEEIKRLAGLSK